MPSMGRSRSGHRCGRGSGTEVKGIRATGMVFFALLILLNHSGFVEDAFAADYYIDRVNGSDTNDGSSTRPWKSLDRLFKNGSIESNEWDHLPYNEQARLVPKNQGALIRGGDTLYLRDGTYGDLVIKDFYNNRWIKIAAASGHKPEFSSITVLSSSHWMFEGLSVLPQSRSDNNLKTYLISLESHKWRGPIRNIRVIDCTIQSTEHVEQWQKEDWLRGARSGIRVDGSHMEIIGNRIKNVYFGITADASHSLIKDNQIINFAGDGLRGLGDYTVFEHNLIKNLYKINKNHNDGFQSWSKGPDWKPGGGVITGVVLRGNTIINFDDENQPLRGELQGIGCFDGMYDQWVIEDNVIITDHWHGISLYGATHCTIRNNLVTGPRGAASEKKTRIMVMPHKNATPSQNNVISRNQAMRIIVEGINNAVVDNETLP